MNALAYLMTNPPIEELRTKWLAISAENNASLLAKQDQINTNIQVEPVPLIDGRYAVCGDVFTETGIKGVYRKLYQMLDLQKLDSSQWIEEAEYLALRPVQIEQ